MSGNKEKEEHGAGALVKTDISMSQLAGMVDEKTLRDFLISSGTTAKLTESQQNLFLLTAKASNLNPVKHEIYVIPFLKKGLWNKKDPRPGDYDMSIVTGYEVYLKRAERVCVDNKRVYDGFDEPQFLGKFKVEKKEKKFKDDDGVWQKKEVDVLVSENKDDPFRCVVKIYRKDRSRPTTHTAYWDECTQGNEMWNTKPRTMLRKVALCQGFRLAFPDEFDGMPYAEEEVPVDHGIIEGQATEPKKLTNTTAATAPDPEKAKLALLRDEILSIAAQKKVSDINLGKSIAKQYNGSTLETLGEEQLLEVKKSLEDFTPKQKERPAPQQDPANNNKQ